MFPINPKPANISITSISPTLVSLTHSLKRQVRRRGGQRWLMDIKYPPLSREEFAPIWAFSIAQQGQFKTFDYIPEIYGSTSGTATGALALGYSKIDGIDADEGDFAYFETLGWTRSSPDVQLSTYKGVDAFIIPDDTPTAIEYLLKPLFFQDIQNVHLYHSVLSGRFAIDDAEGGNGGFQILGTTQALSILNADGTQAFTTGSKRRFLIHFAQDGTNITHGSVTFNGVDTVSVVDEQDNTVINTVPLISNIDFFDTELRILNGLDNIAYLYVNGVLIDNPSFDEYPISTIDNYFEYTSGSASGTDRISYVKKYELTISSLKAGNSIIPITGLTGTLKAGDFIKFDGHDKVYMLTADSSTTLNIEPALIADVSNSEAIIYNNIPFKMAFTGDTTNMSVAVNQHVSFNIKLVEIV